MISEVLHHFHTTLPSVDTLMEYAWNIFYFGNLTISFVFMILTAIFEVKAEKDINFRMSIQELVNQEKTNLNKTYKNNKQYIKKML